VVVVTKALWDHRVIWALKDQWVLKVTKDPQAMQPQKVLKETKEIQVLLDPPVMLAPKELKVLKEIKEIKVQLVILL